MGKTIPEHDAHTRVLHSWDGVLKLVHFLVFTQNNDAHHGQTL